MQSREDWTAWRSSRPEEDGRWVREAYRRTAWSWRPAVASALRDAGLVAEAQRVEDCGRSFMVRVDPGDPTGAKLVPDTCGSRWCRTCHRKRAAPIRERLAIQVARSRAEHGERSVRMVTLPVGGEWGEDQAGAAWRALVEAGARFMRHRVTRALVRGAHVTREMHWTDGERWHPHMHLTADVRRFWPSTAKADRHGAVCRKGRRCPACQAEAADQVAGIQAAGGAPADAVGFLDISERLADAKATRSTVARKVGLSVQTARNLDRWMASGDPDQEARARARCPDGWGGLVELLEADQVVAEAAADVEAAKPSWWSSAVARRARKLRELDEDPCGRGWSVQHVWREVTAAMAVEQVAADVSMVVAAASAGVRDLAEATAALDRLAAAIQVAADAGADVEAAATWMAAAGQDLGSGVRPPLFADPIPGHVLAMDPAGASIVHVRSVDDGVAEVTKYVTKHGAKGSPMAHLDKLMAALVGARQWDWFGEWREDPSEEREPVEAELVSLGTLERWAVDGLADEDRERFPLLAGWTQDEASAVLGSLGWRARVGELERTHRGALDAVARSIPRARAGARARPPTPHA